MFTYPVLSDEELAKEKQHLAPGKYDFEVTSAKEKTSTNGNAMVELVLKVWNHDGNTVTMYDNLMAMPKMVWKIKKFWECVGNPQMYERGSQYDSDYVGQAGRLEVRLQKNDKGEMMSKVGAYLIADETYGAKTKKDDLIDDDLPF